MGFLGLLKGVYYSVAVTRIRNYFGCGIRFLERVRHRGGLAVELGPGRFSNEGARNYASEKFAGHSLGKSFVNTPPELASNDTGLTSNNLNGSLYELHSALKLSASAANKAGDPGAYPREKFSLTHPLDCWKTPHFGEFTIKEAEHHD